MHNPSVFKLMFAPHLLSENTEVRAGLDSPGWCWLLLSPGAAGLIRTFAQTQDTAEQEIRRRTRFKWGFLRFFYKNSLITYNL